MSVDHHWCRVFAVPLSASHSLFLSFSHIVARSVDKDGGPLSLVGRLSKRDSARGAELCDATAAVTWLCRSWLARWASVWSNVCYGGWLRRIHIEERSRKQRRTGRLIPATSLALRDNSAGSLGRWVSGGEKLAWLICKTTVSLFLSPIGPVTKRNSIIINYSPSSNNDISAFYARG